MAGLAIRSDRTAVVLRKLAKREGDVRVARRMLAIANALCGMSRKAAPEAAGMDRQTLRDWVIRYNAHGLDGLCDRWGDGRPARLCAHEQAELARIIMVGPDPGDAHGFWMDAARKLHEEGRGARDWAAVVTSATLCRWAVISDSSGRRSRFQRMNAR